jgi:hypothetical protein
MKVLCHYTYAVLYGFWIYFKGTILGRRYADIMVEMVTEMINIITGKKKKADASKAQREKFINKEKQGFVKLLFDSARDCPICLAEFTEKDQVVALACNK